MKQALVIGAALVAASLSACGGGGGDAAAGRQLSVVATTGVAGDLVHAVTGDRIDLTVLVPPGSDPHAYEPRPDDIRALASASLIVRSGGEIDEWLEDAIQSAGAQGAEQLNLLDAVSDGGPAPPADAGNAAGHAGDVDPHWWHDPRAAVRAVEAIRTALEGIDARSAGRFEAAAADYVAAVQDLDRAFERCVATIPATQRKLITSHDALGSLARRYGFEVVGTVIPSRSTQARTSSGQVADLIELIRREKVRAIFTEEAVDPKVEQALADEAGVEIGGRLFADGLGPEGSAGSTYVAAMQANVRTIVAALGGDSSTCK